MKVGDNKDFWQRMAKSYGLFMQHSRKLYDAICERMRPGLTRDMNVLELAWGSGLRRCAIWRQVFRNDKECDP